MQPMQQFSQINKRAGKYFERKYINRIITRIVKFNIEVKVSTLPQRAKLSRKNFRRPSLLCAIFVEINFRVNIICKHQTQICVMKKKVIVVTRDSSRLFLYDEEKEELTGRVVVYLRVMMMASALSCRKMSN